MIKNCLLTFMIALLTTSLALPARAADQTSSTESFSTSDPRSNLSTIFFTGVGGAVLGLSTLSFYGRPQDHTPNIAIGFAVGIIFGAIYVTAESAQRNAAPKTTQLILPQSEEAMTANRTTHLMASELAPAQWAWSF